MSLADVSARLRLSAAQVSRIETGVADTTIRRLRQFADLYGVALPELFHDHLPPAPGTVLRVRGEIRTGHWENESQDQRMVIMPKMNFELAKLFALECNDPAMDCIYPKGTLLACLPIDALDREIVPGDHLVAAQRDDKGGVQRRLRELRKLEDGKCWLWPRSFHADHQQPIAVTSTLDLEGVVVAAFIQRVQI